MGLAAWLFIETEFVAHRIGKHCERTHARTDFGAWSDDPAASGLNPGQRLANGVDHDVDAGLLIRCAVALLHPGPAHAGRVIKRQLAIASRPHLPAKDAAIELR